MKEKLFYALITIAVLMTSSCQKDLGPGLRPGYLSVILDAPLNTSSSSKEIPSCGGIPVYAVYSLQNEYGVHKDTFEIKVFDALASFTGAMDFPEGVYSVVDISLYDEGWNITHTAPDGTEDVDFSKYITKYLPYTVTIIPHDTTYVIDNVICYTYTEVTLDPPIGQGDIKLMEMESMHFYVPPTSCIDSVILQVDGEQTASMDGPFNGLHTFAVPVEFDLFTLSGYVDGNVVQSFSNTDHSPSNVYYFALNCN